MAKISYDWEFRHTEDYMLLPADYLRIKGLGFFGHMKFNYAQAPIWEHYHQNCMEVSVAVGGRQKMAAGGKEFVLYAGDVLFNYPEEIHSSGGDPQEVSERYYFGLDLRDPDGFLEMAPPWDHYFFNKMRNWGKRQVRISEDSIELLRQSFDHFAKLAENRDDTDSRMYGCSHFMAFLNRLLLAASAEQSSKEDMYQVLNYIKSHIREPLTVEELAERVNMSASYLRKRFKEETGTTPKEYINREKVELAKKLLQEKEVVPMTELAYQLGFTDSAHFSSVFRHFMGYSPREYRKRLGQKEEPYGIWRE